MWHFSFFSFTFCFLFLVSHQHCSSLSTLSVDIVNQTCKICADESAIFSYNFCLASLQSIPISHITNLQGLAIIAMELALENATNTIPCIKKLLKSRAFDPFAMACLEDCLDLYLDVGSKLIASIGAFLSEKYIAANALVSAVMEATTICERGFKEMAAEVSPLTKENYNLFQLCDIALCIIRLLALNPPSESS